MVEISILAFEMGCLAVCFFFFSGVKTEAIGDDHALWKRPMSYSCPQISSVRFDFSLFVTCCQVLE